MKPTRLWENSYYRLVPIKNCRYLQKDSLQILNNVLLSLKIDKPKLKIWVGDAGPLTGICPEHVGSHDRCTAVDLDYFTYSGKGTQYAPVTDRERIWISSNSKNMILDNSKIDWWSIWQFLIRMKSYLMDTNTQFIIHEKIFDLICKNISYKEKLFLDLIINKDTEKSYHHHTHMHLRMKKQ